MKFKPTRIIYLIMNLKYSNLVFLFITFTSLQLSGQVNFKSSHLPIIIIDTDGQNIYDEPKITATMSVVNNEGAINELNSSTFTYDGHIGIELRGQTSQSLFPKFGYGIETRNEDGSNLNVSLLGMPKENDWVLHGPYSDKSLIRNALTYTKAGQLMEYAPRVQFCEVVINQEYLGLYLFTEKIKRDKNRIDIAKLDNDDNRGDSLTGGYILKFDKIDDGDSFWESRYDPRPGEYQKTRFVHHYPKAEDITEEQRDYIRQFITDLENTLMGNSFEDPNNGFRKFMDEDSFIDLILMSEVTKNNDSYRLSTYMYKDRDSKNGKLKMGPVWDFNLAYGNANFCGGDQIGGWVYNYNNVCPDDFWVNHVWWNRMLRDTNFTNKIQDRWWSLRESTFSIDNWNATIDSFVNVLGNAVDRNYAKWPVLDQYVWPNNFIGNSYNAEINYLKTWIRERIEWIDNNINRISTIPPKLVLETNVFPNPSDGLVNIELSTSTIAKSGKLQIFDSYGRRVMTKTLDGREQLLSFEINTAGFYTFYVEDIFSNITSFGKFIIL